MNRTKRTAARRPTNIQVESLEGRQLMVAGPTGQLTLTAQNLLSRQRGFVLERLIVSRPAAGNPASGPQDATVQRLPTDLPASGLTPVSQPATRFAR